MTDFASKRLSEAEWLLIREAYAETYPVRPLLNHVDELQSALRRIDFELEGSYDSGNASARIRVARGIVASYLSNAGLAPSAGSD